MKRTVLSGWSLLLVAVLAIPTVFRAQAFAQDEGTAYALFYAEQDCKAKAPLGEKFIADYKTSQYASPAYVLTVNCYFKLNNFPKVIDMASKLDQTLPDMQPAQKAQINQEAMVSAQQSNNAAQTITFGEKVLSIDSDNLDALITLANTIPIATPQDKAAVSKAEGYAQKAMANLAKMNGKSVGMSDDEWAKQKIGIEGTLHNTLGSIYFNKQDYDKAADELVAATKDMPKDGPTWYLLGLAYNQQYASQVKPYKEAVDKSNAALKTKDQALIDEGKATVAALEEVLRGKRDQAIDALATAVALGGATQPQAMAQLKKIYADKNNGSTDGLDQLIASKKPAQ